MSNAQFLLQQCEKRQQEYILENARLHRRYVSDDVVLATLRALEFDYAAPNHPVISVLIGGLIDTITPCSFAVQRDCLLLALDVPVAVVRTVRNSNDNVVTRKLVRDTALNFIGQDKAALSRLFGDDAFITLLDGVALQKTITAAMAAKVRSAAAASLGFDSLEHAF